MIALIIGATGATGRDLVNILLQDPDYSEVKIFVRRPSGITHPKLAEIITDFDKLENVSGFIAGDVLFSCLGTTLKNAGSKEKQRHIDLEIPAKFAGVARGNGVNRTVLLSAYGASTTSSVFYSRLKGELEERMNSLAFQQYIIFRPGLLLRKDTDRMGERVFGGMLRVVNGLGILKKFRPLPTGVLAEKMVREVRVAGDGRKVVELREIFL